MIGEMLRRERRRRHESQQQAAARFGVSQPSYHRWEDGATQPEAERYGAIAGYLGVTIEDVHHALHGGTAPATLQDLRAELAALNRDLDDLREQRRRDTEQINTQLAELTEALRAATKARRTKRVDS